MRNKYCLPRETIICRVSCIDVVAFSKRRQFSLGSEFVVSGDNSGNYNIMKWTDVDMA